MASTQDPPDLPNEIWSMIGEKLSGVPQLETLRSLVAVSRRFNDIFSPHLYQTFSIRFRDPFSWPESTPLPPRPEHTKDLKVRFTRNVHENEELNIYDTEADFGEWITRAVQSMEHLRAFSWVDLSDQDTPSTFAFRDSGLPHVLKSCKSLKEVALYFTESAFADANHYIPLQGFQDLRSLEIYEFYNSDRNGLLADIVSVLRACPRLKKLGLGMAIDFDYFENVIFEELDCLERLCEEYSKLQTPPLEVECLRVGRGLWLGKPKHADTESGHYINKLLTMESLEILHVFNGVVLVDEEGDRDGLKIDWAPFTREACTKLRQLSVTRLRKDVVQWLSAGGRCIQELIVTSPLRQSHYPFDPFHRIIPEPLTMLFAIDNHRRLGEAETMNVLHCLHDKGAHLKKLAIALSHGPSWTQFLSDLVNLRCLTQLRVEVDQIHWPSPAPSIWPEDDQQDIFQRYAKLASSVCPSLRYIQFQFRDSTFDYNHRYEIWSWVVIAPKTTASSVELRDLSRDESLAIDLFSMRFIED